MNVIRNILGDRYSKNKDMSTNEIQYEDVYDLFNPENLTPQVCARCGERIKLKDISHNKGIYKHKECANKDFKEKREKYRLSNRWAKKNV